MKKLLIACMATSAVAMTAQAGSISLDMRADRESKSYNDAAATRNAERTYLQMLRVDFKGELDSETSYRLRFRFIKNPADVNKRDSLNDSTDFANVTRKVMENFSLTVGKMGTSIGGIEGVTPGPDMYFTSRAYSDQNAERYMTGISLKYKLGDQSLELLSVNQQTDALMTSPGGSTLQFDQSHHAFGAVYVGEFMDKTLKAMASFHGDNVQSTSTTGIAAVDKKYTYTSVGVSWKFKPFFVQADYLADALTSKTTTDKTDTVTTLVSTVGYEMDYWRMLLKFEDSSILTNSSATASTTTKYSVMNAAVEYMPTKSKNFRYHVAYVSSNEKPQTTDTKTTVTMLAGVRLLADFLK